jgi:tRNA(adenine34) deaminase
MGMNDKDWMRLALEQAQRAESEGEIPVGAVLVDETNQCLAVGRNSVQTNRDPSQHAELNVIRQASVLIGNQRLTGTTLYVTLEPCAMCAGLLVHARVKRVVFAARDFKAGAAGSVLNILQGYPLNHRVLIDEGILQQECSELLSGFFKRQR